MPEVEFEGKTFSIDEDGFIDDFTAWCPEWVSCRIIIRKMGSLPWFGYFQK